MTRSIERVGLLLMTCTVAAFAWGLLRLSRGDDLQALYFLVTGALLLGTGHRLLQPEYGRR